MKKVFRIVLLAIFSLLFFVVLNIFSANDHYNVYNNFGFNDQYDNLSINFLDPLQEDQKLEVIERVDEMVNENELAVIVPDYIEEDGQIKGMKNYVAGKDPFVLEMVPNNIKLGKDFYKGRKYVSNDSEEDKNKIDLFTFYKGLTYEVIPFHYLEENLDTLKYDLSVYFSAKDRVLAESVIRDKFSDLNISINTLSHTFYDRDEELEKSIIFISVIAFTLFILFILFTISYRIKDIAVLKLNGFKIVNILSYIFKADLVYSAVAALLIPIFLSALMFRTVNLRIIEFNVMTISVGLMLAVIFIGLILLSTLVINRYRLSDFIKNKNINTSLTTITYGLLILSIFVILPMIQKPMNELIETVKVYTQIRMNAKNIEHVQEIRFNDDSREWEFDQFAQLNNEQNENNQKQIDLYDDLNQMDAIYYFDPTVITPQSIDFEEYEDNLYSAYRINEKYFEESNFVINNESIEIEDSSRLNVLMDVKTFESYDWKKEDFINNAEDAVIYLFDSSDYLNIENDTIEDYKNKEAPIFLYSENENLFMKNLSDGGFYIDDRKMEEINDYLLIENLENEIEFNKVNDREDLYTEGLVLSLWDAGIEVLPRLISLLAVFISFTNFHSLEKNKEMKLFKSLGYRTLEISKKFIGKILTVNIIFILYSLLTGNNTYLILLPYLFILSAVMIIVYIHKIKRARINKI
ncbi:hypothetical protein [Alkalibacterium kapii]|uniref:Uncharacterized protein n=1 Tax=Alkalibacterium kapii TaxID=426704 RepID=A0A511AR94_9LACT|nr:hypothetical protein [Alkalibacterium kapii]GEK90734.1 hypothetical protein AKA01nite_03560 [Alkalibacterium kapii]